MFANKRAAFDNDEDDNTVSVVWHKQTYKFELPPPDAPLSVLRQAIAEKTGVPPHHQKLIIGGAVLAKDLPLKTYGLVRPSLSDDPPDEDDGLGAGFRGLLNKWGLSSSVVTGRKSKKLQITMIGSPETSAVVSDRLPTASSSSSSTPAPSSTQSAPPAKPAQQTSNRKRVDPAQDESRTVAQIDALVKDTLGKLQSSLNNLTLASKSSQAIKTEGFKQQHMYVSEMLLQALLKLDSYDIDARWTEARKTRKEGIKSIQEVLDKVDAMKEGKGAPAPAQADSEATGPGQSEEQATSQS